MIYIFYLLCYLVIGLIVSINTFAGSEDILVKDLFELTIAGTLWPVWTLGSTIDWIRSLDIPNRVLLRREF